MLHLQHIRLLLQQQIAAITSYLLLLRMPLLLLPPLAVKYKEYCTFRTVCHCYCYRRIRLEKVGKGWKRLDSPRPGGMRVGGICICFAMHYLQFLQDFCISAISALYLPHCLARKGLAVFNRSAHSAGPGRCVRRISVAWKSCEVARGPGPIACPIVLVVH